MKRRNDKLTISVDKEIKDRYKEFCDSNGLKIGKQIELFMLNELRKKEVVKDERKKK
jgi:antitoxin component of RelBE/YafQ-DinJ toxin-antitoxin module